MMLAMTEMLVAFVFSSGCVWNAGAARIASVGTDVESSFDAGELNATVASSAFGAGSLVSTALSQRLFSGQPFDVTSTETLLSARELQPTRYIGKSFDEVCTSAEIINVMPVEFEEFFVNVSSLLSKANSAVNDCPECANLAAATGNMLGIQHAWARVSLVVNIIDALQMRNPSFKDIWTKLWNIVLDYIDNDLFFDRRSCYKGLDTKCVLSLFVAYLNSVAAKYFYGMAAVFASILSEMILAVKHMWALGVDGASLWKFAFSLSRLVLFTVVGLLGGAPTGQFADAVVQLGRSKSKHATAYLMDSLHGAFRGIELDDIASAVYDSSLGSACADKVAGLLNDNPAHLKGGDLIKEIEDAEDLLPPNKWAEAVRLDSARVLNSFLWRSQNSFVAAQNKWTQKHYWMYILERYAELLPHDPYIKVPGEARTEWACTMAKRICTNKREPEEVQVVDPIMGDIHWVSVAADIDDGWRVPMPWIHSCCVNSNTCEST